MISPLGVDELVLGPNIEQESGNGSDASRGSHVRTQDTNVRAILSMIPPVERLTFSRDRRIVPENINITQHHQQEGIYPHRTYAYDRRDFPDDSSDDNRLPRG